MRRTVITTISLFILWTSAIYAVDNEKIPKHYQLQSAFEGQNIENQEEAEAVFLKGPDMTPNAVQREDLPGIRFWSIDDYINASPKDRYNALLNMGAYNNRALRNNYPKTTITEGKEQHGELRTTPIESWSKEQYLDITPAEKHSAINNMQKAPFVTAGTETDIVARTIDIADYTQGELLNITPESRHEAISNPTRSFRVGRSADITIDLNADYWYSESSWNLYDSTAGAYYYTSNQTFASASENQNVTLALDPGAYSVDVWDSYGDGGVSGSVTDANAIVLATITSSYGAFGQFGFTVDPPTFDVTISLDADYWYSESSWNVYDSSAGAYYYTSNQTFGSAYENQTVTLALEAGIYSVDVWDSYGDGGVSGSVTDANAIVLATITSSYGAFGQFSFAIGLYDVTVSLDADYWYSESSWNVYDSTAGAYYYSSNQTFSSAYENQTTLFSFVAGAYSVDVWDSYGDGGVSGTVSDADGNTLATITSSYGSFGQFGFNVVAPVAVTSDLFFSEYIEGSSNNKAIEVYNPTDDTLSMDNYLIYTNYNGNPWSGTYTFPTGASLLPGEVFVAAHSSASDDVLQAADSAYAYGDGAYITSFNGDDVRALVKLHDGDSTIIDYIGLYDLVDPGSGWDVAGVSDATKDHTIIRKSSVTMGNTDWAASAGTDSSNSEWMVYDQNYFANIGGHPDDPCWDNAINLSVSSVSYGSEISYMLTNADGDTLVAAAQGSMANNQTDSYGLCLDDGLYTFWGMDDYGDGWNGGSYTITADDGTVIASGAVESSDGADTWVEFPFALNLPVFTANDVDFAGVVIGGSDTKSLTVTNAGYGDSAIMVIDAILSDNTAFAVSGTVSATLAAGESASFSVTYTASAEGNEEAEVSVLYNGGDTSSVSAFGYGVDAVFFEDFDPYTGSATELPMDGWTILDNNGDADSIPQLYKTWYHDDYGVSGAGDGNMVAYIGFSNNYDGDETIVTPMIHLDAPSKVTFQAYDYAYNLDVGYTVSGTIDSSAELTHIATKYVDGFYASTYEVILPDVDSLRVAFTLSGTAYTYFNLDEVSVVALPNTYVSGTVTDAETGSGVDSVAIDINGNTVYTDTAGEYTLYGFTPGDFDLMFSKDGYNSAGFYVEVAEGDSIEQDMALAPEDLTDWSTGFETGDDLGSSVVVYGGGDFTVVADSFMTVYTYADPDTMYYVDTSWVYSPDSSAMLVYPDSGYGYANDAYTYWMADSSIDISEFSSGSYLYLSFDLNIATEEGFDVFLVGLVGDDGLSYFSTFWGNSVGWLTLTRDMSYVLEAGVQSVTPFIAFVSDYGWVDGWGGAFDNIEVFGNPFYLAPPEDLMAESYGSSIPLSWGGPAAAGSVSHTLYRADLNDIENIPYSTFVDDNGNTVENRRGQRNFEQLEIDQTFTGPSSRDLVSYNVFKREWPFGDWGLLTNTDATSYTDDNVADGEYAEYYVTAVYDEGESEYGTDDVLALAGTPVVTVFDPENTLEDFEDAAFNFDEWEQFYSTDAAHWVVGDSALADSMNAFGVGAVLPDDHTQFAFMSDGRAGDGNFESLLISPFMDFSEFKTGVASMAGYAQVYSNFADLNACYLLARTGLGEWQEVINFGYDHMSGWGAYSGPVNHVVAGEDKVQFAIYYTHTGGYNSGYGNGIAIDDLSLTNLAGPTNLAADASIDDITLTWSAPSDVSRPNEYPGGSDQLEKDLAIALGGNDDVLPPNSNFSRAQGDSIGNPFFVDSVEYFDDSEYHFIYWDSASTVGFTDDYDAVCPYTGAGSPDVVYEITLPASPVKLIVSLCESYYDTKVYVFDSAGNEVACSDDYCTASHGQQFTSYIEAEGLAAGTYYIVVDGYGSDEGTYVLEVGAIWNYPGLTYNVYKNGSLADNELDDVEWVDENASLLASDYYVSGTAYRSFDMGYATSDTLIETEPSNEISAAMVNQPPGDFTLLTPNDGDTVMISLDNIGSNQLFAWNASVDPNGTPVEYEVCWNIVSPFDQFCDEGLTSTAQFVPLQDIVDYIDSLQQAGHGYTLDITWQAYASDGMDETEASNGPRTITFDAGFALGVGDELGVPDVFALHQNYPNPFNPVTTIRFDIPQESHVRMDVYNVLGQRVRTLMNSTMQPGFHAVRWDGTNDIGKPLASGMYIYRIQSSKFTSVKKLVLMK